MRAYFGFIQKHLALLGFGFLCVFWGNYGQSFFVSWFGGEIQQSLGISAAQYGGAYSLATLVSGFSIVWAGALIDRVKLSHYVIAVAIGLMVASAVLSTAWNLVSVCVGLYLLRLFGQALLPHTGMTTMARYFSESRGKAVSIAGSGFPVGEILLPLLAVSLIATIGWRASFQFVIVATALVFLPLALWSLKRAGLNEQTSSKAIKGTTNSAVKLLLSDSRYWMALPALTATPLIVTGVFIHQNFVIEQKAWTAELLATGFIVFGVVHWLMSLASGILVDRFSSRQLLPFVPFCLIASLLVLAFVEGQAASFMFMTLLGCALGVTQPVLSSLWAEVYGTENLGAIKSLNMTSVVLATSVSPALFGVFIDNGINATQLFGACAIYAVVGNVLISFSYTKKAA